MEFDLDSISAFDVYGHGYGINFTGESRELEINLWTRRTN